MFNIVTVVLFFNGQINDKTEQMNTEEILLYIFFFFFLYIPNVIFNF